MQPILNMTGQDIVLQTAEGHCVVLPAASVPNPANAEEHILLLPAFQSTYVPLGEVTADDTGAIVPVLVGLHQVSNMPYDRPVIIHPNLEHVYKNRPNTYIPHMQSAIVDENGGVVAFTHLVAI